jgi:hypothetical protein
MTLDAVKVIIQYGDDQYMGNTSLDNVSPENVPAAARVLMDQLYTRLDDQVDAAKLRAHRRRLRAKHRERAIGQTLAAQEEGAGE